MSELLAISFICEPITKKGKETLDNYWSFARLKYSDFFEQIMWSVEI